jgi:hypothetical protein
MFPLSPDYCKERSPIQLNWRAADRILFEACGLGLPGRISPEFLWSGLFREPEQREPPLIVGLITGLAFFRPQTFFSDAKINPVWSRRIQPRSQ